MLRRKTAARKKETCHDGKQSKQRLTLFLCMTMDESDKRDMLVLCKSGKPWCFKESKELSAEHASNAEAWMVRATFLKLLKQFDDDMAPKEGCAFC